MLGGFCGNSDSDNTFKEFSVCNLVDSSVAQVIEVEQEIK